MSDKTVGRIVSVAWFIGLTGVAYRFLPPIHGWQIVGVGCLVAAGGAFNDALWGRGGV